MTEPRRQMRLTPELVARVPPFDGVLGSLPEGRVFATEADHADALAQILAARPADGAIWVFAYGSLIWNPGFEFVEERLGTVPGWHRSFCLGWIRLYRGCTERPGIMLALDAGGSCRGVAFRLPPGPLSAIAFPIDRKSEGYLTGLTEAEVVAALATAAGERGSMAEYLHSTVSHLEDRGIHDRYLWRLQELVAERIEDASGAGRA